jgi:hypothetical protein
MGRLKTGARIQSVAAPRKSANEGAGQERQVTPEQREHMIAEAAYFLAEHRSFMGGDPAQDWLQAETEIDRLLGRTEKPSAR